MATQISSKVRKQLWQKYNHRCAYCGRVMKFSKMTIDHVIPTAKTKKRNNHITNLMPACRICNSQKSAMSIQEFKEFIFERAVKFLKNQKSNPYYTLCVSSGALRPVDDVKDIVFYYETLAETQQCSKRRSAWDKFKGFCRELQDIYRQAKRLY